MLARDVMTREVVTATPRTTIAALTWLLLDKQVGAVPVVGPEGDVLGVVSADPRSPTDQAGAGRAGGASRRDRQQARPDPGAGHGPPNPSGQSAACRRGDLGRVRKAIAQAEWAQSALVELCVVDGVMHLMGVAPSSDIPRALRILAQEIPGVQGVEDRLLVAQQVPLGFG